MVDRFKRRVQGNRTPAQRGDQAVVVEVLEPVRCQGRVDGSAGNRAMAEPTLNGRVRCSRGGSSPRGHGAPFCRT
jgi:hypothetical protein